MKEIDWKTVKILVKPKEISKFKRKRKTGKRKIKTGKRETKKGREKWKK